MNIVIATSEAVPFAKTGGLADVTTALAKALQELGHDVSLFLPYYQQKQSTGAAADFPLTSTGFDLSIPIGGKTRGGRVLRSELPDSDVGVYLIDQPLYFDRPELYTENNVDYQDNCERFVFFSRAVLEAARMLDLRPDVVHANDWQTGLIPALLKLEYSKTAEFAQTGSVLTIHNLAFQGQFWHWDMLLTGLDWKHFNWKEMEFYGHLNLLKTGIAFSDYITTVSPTYAQEIQGEANGAGLDSVLTHCADRLVGILNGVDMSQWNPKIDPHLAQNYDAATVAEGKPACKAALQERMGLPQRAETPVLGMVSRMADQKGFDIIAGCIDDILAQDLQLVFLGTGDAKYEEYLTQLAAKYPDKVAVTVGFNEALAHQIEAGSDMYLMPSRFEPCGLNQMYSLVYGTVPIVRAVGGLADSVVDATPENVRSGTANGFSFVDYRPEALASALQRALAAYQDRQQWRQLVATGMSADWSWQNSARRYVDVYQQAIQRQGIMTATTAE
ncbi:Glycogen synthase [Symmachiella dynata]|uniref:glycogen synthase GlgA n=1 Tax=Symmachiella dynata TaxID=2527995 RepID=UPI00118B5A6C|nr:glycogen synthase GlgA [Symmachiella dynata]QDT49659.1 Glycogen synthase [Symmachiella dynata]